MLKLFTVWCFPIDYRPENNDNNGYVDLDYDAITSWVVAPFINVFSANPSEFATYVSFLLLTDDLLVFYDLLVIYPVYIIFSSPLLLLLLLLLILLLLDIIFL